MSHPKKLLVEGDTDKRVIPYLMEANGVAWGPRENPVVFIQAYGGIDELLRRKVIENELKASGLEALRVLIDANGDSLGRWNQVRDRYRDQFDDLPDEIPESDWVLSIPWARASAYGSCPTIGSPGCLKTSWSD